MQTILLEKAPQQKQKRSQDEIYTAIKNDVLKNHRDIHTESRPALSLPSISLKSVLFGGIAAAAFSCLLGAITCQGILKWVYFTGSSSVFNESMLAGGFSWLFAMGTYKVFKVFLMAFLFSVCYRFIPGNKITKGIVFGITMGIVFIAIAGMQQFLALNLSYQVILHWLFMGIIDSALIGGIIGLLYIDGDTAMAIPDGRGLCRERLGRET